VAESRTGDSNWLLNLSAFVNAPDQVSYRDLSDASAAQDQDQKLQDRASSVLYIEGSIPTAPRISYNGPCSDHGLEGNLIKLLGSNP
jgi:hypothetical protein